jgi:predicted metalloprotease with PDZ domain
MNLMLRILAALALGMVAQAQPIRVNLDASDAPRHLFHTTMAIPATVGELNLRYPEWIPGNHRPSGPIADVADFHATGNGRALAWRRDAKDMFLFHVTVPTGVNAVEVSFDFLAPAADGSQYLTTLSWSDFLVYPAGKQSDDVQMQATLTMPRGWKFGTALPVARESNNVVEFQPSSLTTLVDSPVLIGRYLRTYDLSPGQTPGHYLDVAADSPAALTMSDEKLEILRNLVKETGVAFGSRHYRSYHFLLHLSEQAGTGGLEHHESSDNGLRENYFSDDNLWRNSTTLWHEISHSWNGKYRRPAGLATGNYHDPQEGELLWMYEGLTQYLGSLLAVRSGVWTDRQWRERLAIDAANLDATTGRSKRPLVDTATASSILRATRADWAHIRRGQDYYQEGALIWLEADVLIRRESKGAKSLDTFYQVFFGGPGGKPEVKTYTAAEIYAALNAIQPYDWAGFFKQRIYMVTEKAPVGGFLAGGWKLVYRDEPGEMFRTAEAAASNVNQIYSAGWRVSNTGVIQDIIAGSPVDKAKLAPLMQIVAVNGRAYTSGLLRAAIREARGGEKLEVIAKMGDFFSVHQVDCRTGGRYPDLERDANVTDYLGQIAAPRAR